MNSVFDKTADQSSFSVLLVPPWRWSVFPSWPERRRTTGLPVGPFFGRVAFWSGPRHVPDPNAKSQRRQAAKILRQSRSVFSMLEFCLRKLGSFWAGRLVSVARHSSHAHSLSAPLSRPSSKDPWIDKGGDEGCDKGASWCSYPAFASSPFPFAPVR